MFLRVLFLAAIVATPALAQTDPEVTEANSACLTYRRLHLAEPPNHWGPGFEACPQIMEEHAKRVKARNTKRESDGADRVQELMKKWNKKQP